MIMIAHLFWDTAEHLVKQMSTLVDDAEHHQIFLGSFAAIKSSMVLRENDNRNWISKLSPNVYQGGLTCAWWWRLNRLKTRSAHVLLNILSQILLPQFSINAIIKIARGPKFWVVHGGMPNFPTMLMFKLLGKRVDFIHWGGDLNFWYRAYCFSALACKMCNKIFVLMTPERILFTPFKGDSVDVLPYPAQFMEKCSRKMLPSWRNSGNIPRGIMLGNNVWRRDKYPEILDKLNPDDWDRIVCMLNYGLEGSEDDTQKFIEKYSAKFGKSFYPWIGTLPYDEYADIMSSCPFYVCPEYGQTGLGAIYLGAYQGRALLLRRDNLNWCRELGLNVMDIDAVPDWSYNTLINYIPTNDELEANHKMLRTFFCEQHTKENWLQKIADSFEQN